MALLRTYSKYYEKGFSGSFSETETSRLYHHATTYTVTSLISIVRFLKAEDEMDMPFSDIYPLNWYQDESWSDLCDLWMLGDFLMASRVTDFVEEHMDQKHRSFLARDREDDQAFAAEYGLDLQEFKRIWLETLPGYHEGLRSILATILTSSDEFRQSRTKLERDAILDQLPPDAQRAALHAVANELSHARDAVEEAAERTCSMEVVDDTNDPLYESVSSAKCAWQVPFSELCSILGFHDYALTLRF